MLKKYHRSSDKPDLPGQPRTSFISSEDELSGGIFIENQNTMQHKDTERSIELGHIPVRKHPSQARRSFTEIPRVAKGKRIFESDAKDGDFAVGKRESYEHKTNSPQEVDKQATVSSWGSCSRDNTFSNQLTYQRASSRSGRHTRDCSVYRIDRENSLQHIVLDQKKRPEYHLNMGHMTLPSSSDEKSYNEDLSNPNSRIRLPAYGDEDPHSMLLQNAYDSPKSTTLANIDCDLMYWNMETNSEEVGEETSCSINETSSLKQTHSVISAIAFREPILPGWKKSLKVAELQHVMRLQSVESEAENDNLISQYNKKLKLSPKGGERLQVAKTEILRLKKDKARYWKTCNRYRAERDLLKSKQTTMKNECNNLKSHVRKFKSKLEVEKGTRVQLESEIKQLLSMFDDEGEEQEDSALGRSQWSSVSQELASKIGTLLADIRILEKSKKRSSKGSFEQFSKMQISESNWKDSSLRNNLIDLGSSLDKGKSSALIKSRGQLVALSPEVKGNCLGNLFRSNSNIASQLVRQMEKFEKFNKLYEWRMRALKSKIKDMEKMLKQQKDNWKAQSEKQNCKLADLREKHRAELKSRDQKSKKKLNKVKCKGLQALATLRAELTQEMQDNWKVFLEQAEIGMKAAKAEISSLRKRLAKLTEEGATVQVEKLKKMLKARKLRETELEDRIVQLETISTREAKEALRLTTEMRSLRAEIIQIGIREEESRTRCRKVEEEVHELRQSRTELLISLDVKSEHEKMYHGENVNLILKCERLESEIAELRSRLSEQKSESIKNYSECAYEWSAPGLEETRSMEEAQWTSVSNLHHEWKKEYIREFKNELGLQSSDSENSQHSQRKSKGTSSLKRRSFRRVKKKMRKSRFKQLTRSGERQKPRLDGEITGIEPLDKDRSRSSDLRPIEKKKQNSPTKSFQRSSSMSNLKLSRTRSPSAPRLSVGSINRIRHFNLSAMSAITENLEVTSGGTDRKCSLDKKLQGKHGRSSSDAAINLKSVTRWSLSSATGMSGISQLEDDGSILERTNSEKRSVSEISLEIV